MHGRMRNPWLARGWRPGVGRSIRDSKVSVLRRRAAVRALVATAKYGRSCVLQSVRFSPEVLGGTEVSGALGYIRILYQADRDKQSTATPAQPRGPACATACVPSLTGTTQMSQNLLELAGPVRDQGSSHCQHVPVQLQQAVYCRAAGREQVAGYENIRVRRRMSRVGTFS